MAAFHWFSLFLILSTIVFVNAGRSRRSPIVKGDLAKPDEFRWAVAIVSYWKQKVCSGGIIGERYILSAAHCFIKNRKKLTDVRYTVYPGTINFESARRDHFSVKRPVVRIFVPKDFGKSFFRADIAVLELENDLETRRHNLAILTLPSESLNVPIGELAEVAAFGLCNVTVRGKKVTGGESDGKLRSAKVKIVHRPECHEQPCCMGIFSKNLTIGNDNLLGHMQKDSGQRFGICIGDSGGCLVQRSGQVIGVSMGGFGGSCDERTQPAVYTKVSYYVPFIRRAMSGNHTEDMRVRECPTHDF